MQPLYDKARRLLIGTLLVYALLVAPHLGEFWPFSIYPMFSQGGEPWVRALVREVSETADSVLWRTVSIDALPGEPYPLQDAAIDQNDLANLLAPAGPWDARRVEGVRALFGSDPKTRTLLILRMEGRLGEGDAVAITGTPFLLITQDSTYFNPHVSYP